jgi:hypothetical protein
VLEFVPRTSWTPGKRKGRRFLFPSRSTGAVGRRHRAWRLGEESLFCKLAPTRVPAAGSRLVVAIELSRMHVFDAETELRMTA